MEYLKQPGFESVLYLLFMKERTQKEAIEFIYGKDYSKINVRPFKESRKKMIEDKALESDGSLRNASFKSRAEPFLDHVKEKSEEKDEEISDKELEGLRIFLESEWFEEFFEPGVFEHLPYIARKKNGRLEVKTNAEHGEGAFQVLGNIIDDINLLGSREHSFEDVAEIGSFEDYIEANNEWEYIFEPSEMVDVLVEGISFSDKSHERYRRFLFQKVFATSQIGHNLPRLSVVLYHLDSDIVNAVSYAGDIAQRRKKGLKQEEKDIRSRVDEEFKEFKENSDKPSTHNIRDIMDED